MTIAHRATDHTVEGGVLDSLSTKLLLPCGSCYGCRESKAQGWALRCMLELQEHTHATFTTLTYSTPNLPPTLQVRDVQLFFKRLRKAIGPVRHFTCGEYGERFNRPHYHSIIYGVSARQKTDIETAWGLGNVKTVDATPASIAYVAGYVNKKLDDPADEDRECL